MPYVVGCFRRDCKTTKSQGGAEPEAACLALIPGCSALHDGWSQLAMAWGPATTPLSCGVEGDEFVHATV